MHPPYATNATVHLSNLSIRQNIDAPSVAGAFIPRSEGLRKGHLDCRFATKGLPSKEREHHLQSALPTTITSRTES